MKNQELLTMINPLNYSSWQKLEKLAISSNHSINSNPQNDISFSLKASVPNIEIDFSHQKIAENGLELLIDLAQEADLKNKITALMQGSNVNLSEVRPALHTALRTQTQDPIFVNNQNIIPEIWNTRSKIATIANQIRTEQWLGYSAKPIKDIVNIGIGGSDLGPRFCINAFSNLKASHLGYHFISDADPNAFNNTVNQLNPETTLFIVSSKSFTTPETLYNTKKALAWIEHPTAQSKHFIAVTSNIQKAEEYGFSTILPIWDWVGGRYSLCSAINLITAIAIGYDAFSELLKGAYDMDKHFLECDFERNLPVLSALLGIWNNNFRNIHSLLFLVYLQQLEYFTPYIQQLDMESNGKSLNNEGRPIQYATGPILWGGLGNQAQHSYYQLLCQGTHKIAIDIFTLESFENKLIGKLAESTKKTLSYGVNNENDLRQHIAGNHPVSHIKLSESTPYSLGQLISMYEHKIYTQSAIWNINPFDQPGVESSKRQPYFPQ